ncbi:MAG: ankyrin repeat domain-containing protein [Bacteroidota bacterium]
MRTGSLLVVLLLAGCASAPPEAQPSADLEFLIAEAPAHFAQVRGVADTTQEYGFGDRISSETLYRAPLKADSALEALVTVTTDPDGRVSSTYRATFGLPTSGLSFDQREERRRRSNRNEALRDSLAALAVTTFPGWTLDDEISSSPTVHECDGFFGRRIELGTTSDGARLVIHSGLQPCLAERTQSLLRAAESGDVESLERALDAGAPIDASGEDLYAANPLHLAATGGHAEAVRLLLDRGADPNQIIGDCIAPLRYATLATAPLLLESGADPNPPSDCPNEAALSGAVVFDNLELAILLLEAGANPNLQVPVLDNQGALHFAVVNGSEAMVRLLLDAGAAPDLTDGLQFTPLLYAVSGREIEDANVSIRIADMLLDAGANVNHASSAEISYAWTPLMQAARNGEVEIVQFLLGVDGIDLTARNTEGLTALGAARESGSIEVVAVLEAAGVPE